MNRVSILLMVLATAGCRIQRGGGAPEALEIAPARAGSSTAQPGGASATSMAPPPPPMAAATPSPSAGAAAGGRPSADAMDAGVPMPAPTPPSAPQRPAAQGCGRAAAIGGCNPIRNDGCASELGMQCDVDVSSSVPGGVCVFSAPAPDGGGCENIPPTESCPAGQTCVDFSACRKLCLCDGDCDAGDCCSEQLGSTGFKTCRAC